MLIDISSFLGFIKYICQNLNILWYILHLNSKKYMLNSEHFLNIGWHLRKKANCLDTSTTQDLCTYPVFGIYRWIFNCFPQGDLERWLKFLENNIKITNVHFRYLLSSGQPLGWNFHIQHNGVMILKKVDFSHKK